MNGDRPITAETLFGVVVRTIGLVLVLYGLWNYSFATLELFSPAFRPIGGVSTTFMIRGTAYTAVGVGMIYLAPSIVRLCYAGERRDLW